MDYSNAVPGNYPTVVTELNARISPNWLQIAIWSLLVVVSIGLSLSNFQAYQIGAHVDDAGYIILARSLISSQSYGMINTPGEPAAGRFPFVFPFILSFMIRAFPENIDAVKIPSLLATVLIATLLFWGWRWFSKQKSYWWALAVTGMYALAPMTVDHSRRVMTEPVFTLFCLVSIILAERAVRNKPKIWWTTLLAASLFLAVYTRSIGLVLLGSVFLYLLIKNGLAFWKPLALVIIQFGLLFGLIVLLSPVQLQDALPAEYINDPNTFTFRLILKSIGINPTIGDSPAPILPKLEQTHPGDTFLTKFTSNIVWGVKQHLGKDVRVVAFPVGGGEREQEVADRIGFPFLPQVTGYLITALVFFGLLRLIRQEGLTQFTFFPFIYFLVIFLWVWNDPRLLYPIQSQIHLGLLLGLEWFLGWIPRIPGVSRLPTAFQKVPMVALVCLFLALWVYKSSQIEDSRLHTGDIRERTQWIAENSAPETILMTEVPTTDYLYSRRKTVSYPRGITSPNELEKYITQHQIDFILVAPHIEWQSRYMPDFSQGATSLLPIIEQLALDNRIRLEYSTDQDLIKIYRIQP